MKRIKQIVLHGFEGQDQILDFANGNLLLGGVGSGKSSVINALRFAALGYVPALGRTPAFTARLLPGGKSSDARVHVRYDDGSEVDMILTRSGGKVGITPTISWGEGNATALLTEIRALYGANQSESEQHLDMRALVNASAAERTKVINAMLDATAGRKYDPRDVAMLYAAMRILGSPRLPDPSTPNVKAMAEGQLLLLEPDERAALKSQAAVIEFEDLAADIRFANGQKNTTNRTKNESLSALQEFEKQLEDSVLPAGDSEDALKDRIARVEGWLQSAIRAETTNQTLRNRVEEQRETLTRLKAGLAEAADPELGSKISEAEKVIVEKRGILEGLVEPANPPMDPPALPSREASVTERIEALKAEELRLRTELDALNLPKQPSASTTVNDVCDAAETAVRLFDNDSTTPAMTAILKELAVVVTAYRGDYDALHAWRAECERIAAAQVDLQAKAGDALHNALQADSDAHEAQREAHKALLAAFSEEQKAHQNARVIHDDMRRDVRVELDDWVAEHHHLIEKRGRVAAIQERIDMVLKQIENDEREMATLDMSKHPDDFRASLATARKNLDAFTEHGALRRARDSAADEAQDAGVAFKVWGALEFALKDLRNREVGDRAAPLVLAMEKFLDAAGLGYAPFVEVNRTRCDFGWQKDPADDDTRVMVETLSGGETVLFMTALAYAVLVTRAPEVSVLTVEAAEVGIGAEFDALLDGLREIAPDLSHVIVATCNPVDLERAPVDWAVHNMEPAHA